MNSFKPLPSFFINKEKANKLIKNFQETKHPILSQAKQDDLPETKYLWYSIEYIRQLYEELAYLQADGLRVYLGSSNTSNNGNTTNQICLVMIPTRIDFNTYRHQDIIIEETQDFDKRPGNDRYETDEYTSRSREYNEDGLPCPPYCLNSDCYFPY